jgi:hypothetical protein
MGKVCTIQCAWGPSPPLGFGEARHSLGEGGTPARRRLDSLRSTFDRLRSALSDVEGSLAAAAGAAHSASAERIDDLAGRAWREHQRDLA